MSHSAAMNALFSILLSLASPMFFVIISSDEKPPNLSRSPQVLLLLSISIPIMRRPS